MPLQEMVGTFQSERNRFESGYMVGQLANKTVIVGSTEPGALVPGLEYVFIGDWKTHPIYGSQFAFQGFSQKEPTTRAGVVAYLTRMDVVSSVRVHKMVDIEGHSAVIGMLKADPAGVAFRCFAGDRAYQDLVVKIVELGARLKGDQKFQEAKVQLLDLFVGRGFPHTLPDACVKRFGAFAAKRIRKDPFTLMIEKLPGCGFLRVDQLYVDLGLPKDRMKRQVMCAWHHIHSSREGTTWHLWSEVAEAVGRKLSGNIRINKALRVAVRAKWLTSRTVDGKVWIADRQRAEDEDTILKQMEKIR